MSNRVDSFTLISQSPPKDESRVIEKEKTDIITNRAMQRLDSLANMIREIREDPTLTKAYLELEKFRKEE